MGSAQLAALDALASSRDLATARRILADFDPPDAAQEAERDRILAFTTEHPDAALRSCAPGHLTASALVLDAAAERVLLTLHRKLGRWLQLGGHCDGETNLARAALVECLEESGIPELVVDPVPIDVDVHAIPARPGEPEHLHLDTRFLVHAPAGAAPVRSSESLELAWVPLAELETFDTDDSVRRLARRVPDRRPGAAHPRS